MIEEARWTPEFATATLQTLNEADTVTLVTATQQWRNRTALGMMRHAAVAIPSKAGTFGTLKCPVQQIT